MIADPTQLPTIDQLVSSLKDWNLWIVAGGSFVLGVIGAAVHGAVPSTPPAPTSNRWLAALVGGVAAVVMLWVSTPRDALAWLAGALVAGYAGKAVLDGVASKVIASAAQNKLQTLTAQITQDVAAPPVLKQMAQTLTTVRP